MNTTLNNISNIEIHKQLLKLHFKSALDTCDYTCILHTYTILRNQTCLYHFALKKCWKEESIDWKAKINFTIIIQSAKQKKKSKSSSKISQLLYFVRTGNTIFSLGFHLVWKCRQFASTPDSNSHVVIGDSAWRIKQRTESIPGR